MPTARTLRLLIGIGDETVERDHDGDAELLHVADVPAQVLGAALHRGGVSRGHRSFLTPRDLQRPTVATMIAASGLSAANRHLMVEEFFGAESAPKPASVNTISESASRAGSPRRIAAVRDVAEGAAVHERGPTLERLHEVWLIASLSSRVIAPCALRSLARTAVLSPRKSDDDA